MIQSFWAGRDKKKTAVPRYEEHDEERVLEDHLEKRPVMIRGDMIQPVNGIDIYRTCSLKMVVFAHHYI